MPAAERARKSSRLMTDFIQPGQVIDLSDRLGFFKGVMGLDAMGALAPPPSDAGFLLFRPAQA